jgi:hypothetical protein
MGCADSKPETWYADEARRDGGGGGGGAPRAPPARRPQPQAAPDNSTSEEGDTTDGEGGAGFVPRRVAALNAGPAPSPMSAQPPRQPLPYPQAQPPVEDKLPLLLGRLNKPDADWDKWGINELTKWCRESVRSRPHQSSIAILLLSHENGALLDLVSESFNGASLQSDAALRLRKGRVDIGCAWGGGQGGAHERGGVLASSPLPRRLSSP